MMLLSLFRKKGRPEPCEPFDRSMIVFVDDISELPDYEIRRLLAEGFGICSLRRKRKSDAER